MLPKDPYILLSAVNTKLRDFYPELRELCLSLNEDEAELCARLEEIGYRYDAVQNQFVPVRRSEG